VQLCKALGAERVILTGTRDERLEIGRRLGADFVINVRREKLDARVSEITSGKGADSVLECAGGPGSMQDALENVKRGGRIGVVAWYAGPVEMDMNLAVRSNVRIYAARGEGGMNSGRSLALMSEGKLVADPMISHHFKLDQIHEAFDTYVNRVGNALKVAIQVGGLKKAHLRHLATTLGLPRPHARRTESTPRRRNQLSPRLATTQTVAQLERAGRRFASGPF
jgi:L-iditol 2-dehydrogenase